MTTRERGFTVMETLLATALLLAIAIGTVGLVSGFARAVNARGSASGGAAQTENALIAMRNDAATAFAVFVPSKDVYGAPNGTAGAAAHEFDYYSKAEDGSESWWAYTYDANAHTVRRWDYQPNAAGTGVSVMGAVDRDTGAIDPSASYPAITGVTAFSVQTLEASQLATGANAFGPLIASLAASAGVAPASDPVGFVPSSQQARADLYGGNTTVAVSLTTANATRTFHLATSAVPSGFTIHAAPAIRAFAYRLDFGHRFWFGFAQKTWARIFEQVQYSYTPAVGPWHVWCDFQLYGAGINGLALNDPNASYHPTNWNEATAGAFYMTTQGDVSALNPEGCGKQIPGRTTTAATPSPVTTQPDLVDTPPPCFVQGQCWPQNAPVNWAPPSPWPPGPPPPAWCEQHAESTLCGGIGGTPVPIGPSASPPDPDTTTYPVTTGTPAPIVTPPFHHPIGPGPIAL